MVAGAYVIALIAACECSKLVLSTYIHFGFVILDTIAVKSADNNTISLFNLFK